MRKKGLSIDSPHSYQHTDYNSSGKKMQSFSFENIKRLYLNSFQRRHYYESERYYDKRREYSSSVYFERLARLVKIIGKDTVNIIKNGLIFQSLKIILWQSVLNTLH